MNPKQESTDRIEDKKELAYNRLLSALSDRMEATDAPEGTIPVEIEDLQLLKNWIYGSAATRNKNGEMSPSSFFQKYLP